MQGAKHDDTPGARGWSGDLAAAIGHTPLIRLRRASEATGCTILGKAEFMNPGQSVKDRAALQIIRDAEARGALRPGGLIVEGTAGNTGIGLAMVGAALGYRALIVLPRTQSQEKKDAIRLLGAELVEVDAPPPPKQPQASLIPRAEACRMPTMNTTSSTPLTAAA